MTFPSSSGPAPADLRPRAVTVLGLEAGMNPADQATVFHRLEEEDFVPPLAWHQALRLAQGGGASTEAEAPVPEQALAEEEARLRSEVEELAATFFALPMAERRGRLDALKSRCAAFRPLLARLRDLEAGVTIDVAAFQDSDFRVNWLARYVCDLRACPPTDRAARRQALRRSMSEENMALWQAAAIRLGKRYRDVAALEAPWVEELATWSRRQRHLARARRRRQLLRNAATPAPRPNSFGGTWPIIVGIMVLGNLLRLLSGTGSHRHDPTPPRFAPTTIPRLDYTVPGNPTYPWSTAPAAKDGAPSLLPIELGDGNETRTKEAEERLRKWLEAHPQHQPRFPDGTLVYPPLPSPPTSTSGKSRR